MALHRGGSEILYLVLSVLVIISVIGAGLPVIDSFTSDTKESIEEPNFDLASTQPILIEYTADRALDGDNTNAIYLTNQSTFASKPKSEWIEIYPSTDARNTSIHGGYDSGTVMYNNSHDSYIVSNQQQIDYGETAVIVWENTDNQLVVVNEFYIPSTQITGTSVSKNYSLGGCIDEPGETCSP